MLKFRFFVVVLILAVFSASCGKKATVRTGDAGPFEPEKAFERANQNLEEKDYEKARNLFLEIRNRDLTQKYAPLAQLKIADSYIKEDEPDLAVAEYRKFIELYPTNKYAPNAQYQIAMAHFNQIESPERGYGAAGKALDEFMRLKEIYPRNQYRDVIDLNIEKCVNTIADYEFLVGKFYFDRKAYKGALGRFRGILMNMPDYKAKADVFYFMALSYKGLGDTEKAEKYLKLVVEKYSDRAIAKEAEKQLQRLGKGKS
jgi:outer membrane protein assembly factor BamD